MPFSIGFAAQTLDRADHIRRDPGLLAQAQANPLARTLKLNGLVPVLHGEALGWEPLVAPSKGEDLLFLGLLDGQPRFVIVPYEADPDPADTHSRTWAVIAVLNEAEQGVLGGMRSLVNWHRITRFCARCGGTTVFAKGGWQRNCTACGVEHFPRVDPVVIMLVEHDGALLLGREARFSVGRYSALAGFLEPGETVEDAVAREVFEEVGVRLKDVRYIASQPWPFPGQLMIACIGTAQSRDLVIDYNEVEDARWYSREEVAEAIANGASSRSFIPPPPQAVAHMMLQWWLEQR